MKLKYIVGFIVGLILLLVYFNFNPTSTYFPKCPLYATTGIYCPGCGSQRAFHNILHFDFKGMVSNNILFPFGILTLTYHFTIVVLNKMRKRQISNVLYAKHTPIIILVVIVIYWILRNLPFEPFNWLAPN